MGDEVYGGLLLKEATGQKLAANTSVVCVGPAGLIAKKATVCCIHFWSKHGNSVIK